MLRRLVSRWNPTQLPALARAAGTARVADRIVTFTVVDKLGRRHVLRGLEGQSVVDVVQQNGETLGEDVICLSPDGRGKWEAHVKVPNELHEKVPAPTGDDEVELTRVALQGTIDKHSRLGSHIVLSKELDGMLLAVADVAPWRTL